MQRRQDPRKNDLRASGFAELPPGPAKLPASVTSPSLHAPHFGLCLLFLFFVKGGGGSATG